MQVRVNVSKVGPSLRYTDNNTFINDSEAKLSADVHENERGVKCC